MVANCAARNVVFVTMRIDTDTAMQSAAAACDDPERSSFLPRFTGPTPNDVTVMTYFPSLSSMFLDRTRLC
jgi:hypothetical protein